MSDYLPLLTMLVLATLFAALSFLASALLGPAVQADGGQGRPVRVRDRAHPRAGRALPGALLPGGDDLHHLRHRDHLPLPVGGHLPAELEVFGLVEMVVFAVAVFVSFVYLISNGALDWGPAKRVRPVSGVPSERTTESTIRRIAPAGPSPPPDRRPDRFAGHRSRPPRTEESEPWGSKTSTTTSSPVRSKTS